MAEILNIQDLTVKFPHEGKLITAVDKVTFSLEKGEVLGIVGESGSGKSISSLSMMGLLPPSAIVSSGKITYGDKKQDLLRLGEKEYRKIRGKEISMIFQEPMTSLNPVVRCGRQVKEALHRHVRLSQKDAKAKVIDLFREVGLPRPEKMYSSYPHEISGGQKQRVMIAMAISCEPKLIIADEPTTALDVTVQKNILNLLLSLQKKYGMSMIFITHDLGVVSEIADKLLVLYKGKIVEQGKTKAVFADPQHAYTKGLLACRPPLDHRLDQLPTVESFMKGEQESGVVSLEQRKAQHKEIFSSKAMLEVNNLHTWFPDRRSIFGKSLSYVKAVNSVSLDVYPGETLGLVGESGCGKTTLGRTILRLNRATGGDVYFEGKDIFKLKAGEFKRLQREMQIIFQDPYSSLNPRLQCGEAIMEPMKVHKLVSSSKRRKERALEIMLKAGLDESFFCRYPHELSGGQRQRVCIARALAMEPRFIVCDESVSALDVSVQAQVINLLNELKTEFGFTYIFISHDLAVVRYMADRIVVMKDGKIVEHDEADKLFNNPQDPYTKKLIDSIPGK